MAAWLPIIKTVVPLVTPIVQAAMPAFTKPKGDNQEGDAVTARHIEELQAAVNANNEYVKTLANALEESAKANDAAFKRMRLLTRISLLISIVAVIIAVLAWT